MNRRNSDLTDKADGVLYTSDGRDVEMSVASTKAFYSQVAAGFLLAFALASELGAGDDNARAYRHERLVALRELPDAMTELVGRREAIAGVAQRNALSRRSWALVGNGVNRIAAHEIRIKLSELCYKSIVCDVTEDKKHIDLSAEPMILVCAAGLRGSNADDVAKEMAIYRAHKAAPIAIVDDGEARFSSAVDTIAVPSVHPDLAFVLCTVAGHLFGYEAALAIDATARPLREARGCIEHSLIADAYWRRPARRGGRQARTALVAVLRRVARRQLRRVPRGRDRGTARVALALRHRRLAPRRLSSGARQGRHTEHGGRRLDGRAHESDRRAHPADRRDQAPSQDRHGRDLAFRRNAAARAARPGSARGRRTADSLTYRSLRTLVALDPTVEAIAGWTRYSIAGETIHVVDRGGIARDIPSRTDANPVLLGTKHRAATEREVTVARGADGRTLILVPEVKGNQTTGLTLLHTRFRDRLPGDIARRVLEGYRDRYRAIADQVTETQPVMHDDVLASIDLVELLTEPVVVLAEAWR